MTPMGEHRDDPIADVKAKAEAMLTAAVSYEHSCIAGDSQPELDSYREILDQAKSSHAAALDRLSATLAEITKERDDIAEMAGLISQKHVDTVATLDEARATIATQAAELERYKVALTEYGMAADDMLLLGTGMVKVERVDPATVAPTGGQDTEKEKG